jgi:uncharacterized protein involved in exopolysaccharide biosynthesis
MKKEAKLPDDAQYPPARPTIPAGYPPGVPEGAPHLTVPGGGAPYPPCAPEEDEINLLDLFIVLLRHKVMILSVVFLAGIAAVGISLLMPNIYRSECTISPTAQEKAGGGLAALGGFGAMIASEVGIGVSGSLEQFEVVLKSRELTKIIIDQYNLMPVIFEDDWDAENKKWKSTEKEEQPNFEDAYGEIHNLLSLKPDKKQEVLRVSFQSKNPLMAQTILNYYIVGMSEFLRRQTLEDASAQQVHLSQQLSKTTDPLLKNRLYELIAKQIEKETLAKVQKYYSFNVIDPPYLPERKFKPKRAQICVISVVAAFFIAIFLAFFMEYVKKLKTREEPERLANLRNAIRLRRRP